MIIVALLIGVMVGFASGWEISALQFRRTAGPSNAAAAPAPSPEAVLTPPVNGAMPPATGASSVPATSVVYRAVVDAVVKGGLKVTVKEGVVGEPQVTLASGTYVALRPVQPAPQDNAKWDTSKGLPPPPTPPADPYAEEPMKLADFKAGDVVEFSSADVLKDGSSVTVSKVVWIMSLAQQTQQGGPIGDGTAAPSVPKK